MQSSLKTHDKGLRKYMHVYQLNCYLFPFDVTPQIKKLQINLKGKQKS